ncbi:DUF4328 domain-containing protein [Gordonia insulae]|uniref:DUF4328 domain-containing protein n=1 Tax=Gordonia insulae TaxID=2420509 RepID=A0A3G8JP80_9ACTN|nr:DUF4328 domain-containing protein [Gordonia insulae]AZG46897.1 hypothetical protein D7316_03502 [Gordonia insulae]
MGPRPIPRYVYIPQWGLRDVPDEVSADPRSRAEVLLAALVSGLRSLAVVLGLAALVHLARYVLIVVNKSMPVPAWTDWTSSVLVMFVGLLALGAYVYVFVVFTRWIIDLRAETYRSRDRRDPRPRWQIAVLAAVPLLNVAGAALLLHEVARLRDDLDPDRTRRRFTRIWVAWTIVNVLALVAIATRVVAMFSGSIQTAANGLAAVIISSICSAVFAWWLADRLAAVFGAAHAEPVPSRRWVTVG